MNTAHLGAKDMTGKTWTAPWEATDRMLVAGLEHGGWGAAESYADMRDAYLAEHPSRADEVLRLRAQCEQLAKMLRLVLADGGFMPGAKSACRRAARDVLAQYESTQEEI